MHSIDRNKIFWRKVEDETILLNIDDGFYYTLDEVGSIIWRMVVDNEGEDKIIAQIMDEYDVDETTVKKDVKNILKKLEKESIIEKV